jgi:hypothetical protein
MRLRQLVGMMAVFGVLLHAVAVVRHHGLMLGTHLQYQALVSDLSAICHGGQSKAGEAPAELPYVPKPLDAQNGCPICSGQVPAFAVVSFDLVELPAPGSVLVSWDEPRFAAPSHLDLTWPPARGPPSRDRLPSSA